jgi:hypothetical protein
MPYDNAENRSIKHDVDYINKRFVEHTDALGTSQTINYRNPAVGGAGFSRTIGGGDSVMGGGVGCAEFKGASSSKHEKGEHSKCPCGGDDDESCLCGGTNLGYKSKDPVGVSLSGGAILGLEDNTILGAKVKKTPKQPKKPISFGSLGESLSANLAVGSPDMNSATAVRASAIKDPNSPIETLPEYVPQKRGRGRPRSSFSSMDKTSSPMRAPRVKKGGNGFASGTHMDNGEGPATLGVRSRKTKKGGAMPDSAALPTATKITVKSTPKKEVKPMTEKAQFPSSTLSGLGKPKKAGKSARAEIVKRIMSEKGLKMIEASKYVKEHNLY